MPNPTCSNIANKSLKTSYEMIILNYYRGAMQSQWLHQRFSSRYVQSDWLWV